jgi:hypothetical protein
MATSTISKSKPFNNAAIYKNGTNQTKTFGHNHVQVEWVYVSSLQNFADNDAALYRWYRHRRRL